MTFRAVAFLTLWTVLAGPVFSGLNVVNSSPGVVNSKTMRALAHDSAHKSLSASKHK